MSEFNRLCSANALIAKKIAALQKHNADKEAPEIARLEAEMAENRKRMSHARRVENFARRQNAPTRSAYEGSEEE